MPITVTFPNFVSKDQVQKFPTLCKVIIHLFNLNMLDKVASGLSSKNAFHVTVSLQFGGTI